jgi:hypothetical protein
MVDGSAARVAAAGTGVRSGASGVAAAGTAAARAAAQWYRPIRDRFFYAVYLFVGAILIGAF